MQITSSLNYDIILDYLERNNFLDTNESVKETTESVKEIPDFDDIPWTQREMENFIPLFYKKLLPREEVCSKQLQP